MRPPSETYSHASGGILLIEEYEALAVGFVSALKRIAPDRDVRAVNSLEAAETAVRERKPALLILDVDPPHRGAVAFFDRLKSLVSDARVLILGVGVSLEVANEPNGPGAFGFLEKPFELEEFASVVRSLLHPESANSAGTLRDLNLVDLIALHAVGGSSAVLKLDGPRRKSGEIHFAEGAIVHAAVLGHSGLEALKEMLRWKSPHFLEVERTSTAPRTIRGSWSAILLHALRSAAHDLESAESAVAPEIAPQSAVPGKKIVIVDDTEMLLIFLVEILSTSDPTLRITTASLGMDGLQEIGAAPPDLVLLDYSLPDLTGAEVCRRLLEDGKTAAIPVIMMSGHVPEMMVAAERYSNVVATIAKPFLSTSLLELVQKTLAELPGIRRRKRVRARGSSAEVRFSKAANGKADQEGKTGEPLSQPPIDPPDADAIAETTSAEAEIHTVATSPLRKEEISVPQVEAEMPIATAAAPARGTPSLFETEVPEPETKLLVRPRHFPLGVSGLTPAAVRGAKSPAVVLSLPLEILSIELSATLRPTAIRARPFASTVSLHMPPQAFPDAIASGASFEVAQVNLDARGQIDLVHLAPTLRKILQPQTRFAYPVSSIAVVSGREGGALQLTPAAIAPMRMQLLALFELEGVKLSASFGLGHLVLKARGNALRLSFSPGAAETGATFASAQVLLDRSSQIAEILLDSFA